MLHTLTVTNFRNLAQVRVTVPPEANVIALVGPNGVGKTSVLEAISLLTPTRGLLGAEAKAQIRHGEKEAGIHADLTSGDTIGQLIKKGERLIHINTHKEPAEALARTLSVVWLTPATDFLFSGPPEVRRRWLDEATTALIPAHAGAVARFRQHRQSRLKILTSTPTGSLHADWLDAEEKLAAEWGVHVLQNRHTYLTRLAPHLSGLTLALQGAALEVLETPDPVATLKGKFERSRDIDARVGRTHAGPNTLEITGNLLLENTAIPMAQASSGQHKRGLITWLVGHVRLLAQARAQAPVVLIDEFSAHLDATRRASLLQTLHSLGSQVWLSDIETPTLSPHTHIITLNGTENRP